MAVCISKWAHHRTTQNNWRIFNIVTLSFLKKNGYEIDDELLKSQLLWVCSYHSGNGWYLEQTYDYYTISLFIVYGTIWNRAFGDEYYPEISDVIENSAHELMKTYINFFARDGHITMWARSILYRTWVSGGFPVSFIPKENHPLDPGLARRLCSGSLLQFVTREDFYENNAPSMGFYGHREFVLQDYSCPGSPFIMFLPFICLALPEDSPFWTARENEGFWPDLGEKSKVSVLENPGLVLINHGKTGTSEIIPGGVIRADRSRLAFEHELTLGHFGLPHINGKKAEINKFSDERRQVITASVKGRRLVLVSYAGWNNTASLVHKGRNAETEESTVLYIYKKRTGKNPPMELMITIMLHRMDSGKWTEDELDPVKEIKIMDITPEYSALGAQIILRDKRAINVDFKNTEGYRSC